MRLISLLGVLAVFALSCVSEARAAVTFRSRTTVNQSTLMMTCAITKPSGTVAGDVMVATFQLDRDALVTPPVGWNLVVRQNSPTQDMGLVAYVKVATASEGASYAFALSQPSWCAGGILTYVGVATDNPIDVSNAATGNNSPMGAPSVALSVPDTRLVCVWAVWNDMRKITQTTSMANRVSLTAEAPTNVSDQAMGTITASGVRNATAVFPQAWVALSFALRPLMP